jgi:hypothetical protein
MKLFVDGEERFSSSQSGSLQYAGNVNLEIGRNTASSYAPIKVGQVRAHSLALTQAQIRQNYNFTKRSYPNGYDGVLGGGVTADKPTWNSGGYFDFDGSNDYISIPSTAAAPIDFTAKNYSIAAWVNVGTAPQHPILTKYGVNDSIRSINFNVNSQRKLNLYERVGSSGQVSTSTSALSLNTWHHVCMVRSATQVKFYIDGAYVNVVSATGTPNSGGTQNVNIGSQANGNYAHLNGKLSQVKMYDRALDVTEIATLHSQGR